MIEKNGIKAFGCIKGFAYSKSYVEDYDDYLNYHNKLNKSVIIKHIHTLRKDPAAGPPNKDMFTGETILGPGLYVDGDFVFPSEFLYYFEKYDIGIPYEYEEYLINVIGLHNEDEKEQQGTETITLETIEKKLGFDPLHPVYGKEYDHENDNIPSPYEPLTLEELEFLREYMREERGLVEVRKVSYCYSTRGYSLLAIEGTFPENWWGNYVRIDGIRYKRVPVFDMQNVVAIEGAGDFLGKEIHFI